MIRVLFAVIPILLIALYALPKATAQHPPPTSAPIGTRKFRSTNGPGIRTMQVGLTRHGFCGAVPTAHRQLSRRAAAFGNTLSPEPAYRFARRGGGVVHRPAGTAEPAARLPGRCRTRRKAWRDAVGQNGSKRVKTGQSPDDDRPALKRWHDMIAAVGCLFTIRRIA